MLFCLSLSERYALFGAGVGAGAAADAFFGVQNPCLVGSVHLDSAHGALFSAECAVNALFRVRVRLAILHGCGTLSSGRRRRSSGGSGLAHGRLLDESPAYEQILFLRCNHVVVARKLNGMGGAEVRAGGAEGA